MYDQPTSTLPGSHQHGGNYTSDFNDHGGGGNSYGGGNKGGYEKKPWQNKGGGGNFQRKEKPEDNDPILYRTVVFTGDKDTPKEVLLKVQSLVRDFEAAEFKIRCGGDGPVEMAANDAAAIATKELILPWKEFQGLESKLTWSTETAKHIAKKFHGAYDMLPKGTQGVLAKNARLIMGHNMRSKATALVIWTPDGVEEGRKVTRETGYFGHVIKIAAAANVKIFNLGNPTAEQRIRDFLEEATAAMAIN